jgi:choice-of-anchor B domain-containing protein
MKTRSGRRIITVIMALGGIALCGGSTALGQFTSSNATLRSWIDLATFGAGSGNDCWGYVSPSGREYALMGIRNAMAVVEVTDPDNPVIVASVPHSDSLWGDMKTYGSYAYVVNETGGGIDVVDLSNVDSGMVTHVQSVIAGGLSTSHNVAIDVDSGFLYLPGSNLNGGRLVAYDLSNPANPTFAGQVDSGQGAYSHDAQIVTFTTGPNAGKQIAFSCNGSVGLDIYDVTDKSNMFRLSRTPYANLSYCHQGWLSEDGAYFYVNDELDGVNETVIFNVTNLSAPVVANTYSSGVAATDHNLYVHDGFIYEAEYRAGLRVFDASDPLNPVQVAWYDSYPENDGTGYDGAWSVYPFFPSGNIIISDINRGMFVVTRTAPQVAIEFPDGRPDLLDPAGDSIRVRLAELQPGGLVPGSGQLHYDTGGGFTAVPLVPVSGDLYDAVFPSIDCGTAVSYYVGAVDAGENAIVDPPGAPTASYAAAAALGLDVAIQDDMETNTGWSVESVEIADGAWDPNPSVPVGGGGRGDPPTDADGSGACWLTDNVAGDSDVDGGPTMIISPVYDLSGLEDPFISYARWFSNDDGDNDRLDVHISDSDGALWMLVESVPGGAGWETHTFRAASVAPPGSQIRLRFSATDNPNDSVSEAALDDLRIFSYICDEGGSPDIDGDGDVDVDDLTQVILGWGECPAPPTPCPADIDGNGVVDVDDLTAIILGWG